MTDPVRRGVRLGARLGIDLGDVRIGIARSDPHGLLATPLETVPRGRGDLDRIVRLAAEHEVTEIVVGLPRSLNGREGPAAAKARDFATALATTLARSGTKVSVRLVDERLSTVTAESVLRSAGKKGSRRRQVVDQAAAVVILQNALDAERGTGVAPGETVLSGEKG